MKNEGEWTTGQTINDKDGVGSLKIKIVRIKAKTNDSSQNLEGKQLRNKNDSRKEGKSNQKDDYVIKNENFHSNDFSNKRLKLQSPGNSIHSKEVKMKENSGIKASPASKKKLPNKNEPPKLQIMQTIEKKESPLEKAKRLLASSRESEDSTENNSAAPKTSAMLKRPPSRKRFPPPSLMPSSMAASLIDQTDNDSEPFIKLKNSSSQKSSDRSSEYPTAQVSSSTHLHPLVAPLEPKHSFAFQSNEQWKDMDCEDEIDIVGDFSKHEGDENGKEVLKDGYGEGSVGRMAVDSQSVSNDNTIEVNQSKKDELSSELEKKSINTLNPEPANETVQDCDRKDEHSSKFKNRNQRKFNRSNSNSHSNNSKNSINKNNRNDSMVFVGDLPPYCSNKVLAECFSNYATVVKARVIDHQCYGFVTFNDRKTAQDIISMAENGHAFHADQSKVRVSWAHGSLPEWKVGTGGFVVSKEGDKIEINKSASAKDKTLAAAAAAAAAAAQVLAGNGPPVKHPESHAVRERHIVAYNDLL